MPAFVRILWPAALLLATQAHAALVISGQPTKHVHCSAGTCTAGSANAVLNVSDLTGMLATSDVTLVASSQASGIEAVTSFSWTSTSRLTLSAAQVSVAAPVVVAGPGGLSIPDGALAFAGGGKVTFWDLSSSLVIGANAYTLAGSIASLSMAVAANPSGFFALANDYDASPDGTYASTPVASLNGTLERLGNTISNFTLSVVMNRTTVHASLIEQSGGTIRDIGIANVNIAAGGKKSTGWAGALVLDNKGTIENSFATGQLSATLGGKAGGLAMENDGQILRCRANVAMTESTYMGGLVAINTGTISQSHADGATNGSFEFANLIGGLAAESSGVITLSYATGPVQGSEFVGGLTGFNSGTVSQSFAEGAVTSSGGPGGLIGLSDGAVSDSYATGSVTDTVKNDGAGGLLGATGSFTPTVSRVYAAGAITAHGSDVNNIGGLDGYDEDGGVVFSNAYWDMTLTGIGDPSKGLGNVPNEPGITGLTHSQLVSGLPAGFDPAVWGRKKKINGGMPYLLANPPPDVQ